MSHYQKRFRPLFIIAIVIALSFIFFLSLSKAEAVSYPFSDDVENLDISYWTADSPWARITTSSHSPNYAWTDSPASNYENNTDVSLTSSTSINLTSGANPQLAYWYKYHLEDDYDVMRVEISLNGGATWESEPLAVYSGYKPSWQREQIDLSPYAGYGQVKIRFRLVTDGTVVRDGFYLDDIVISDLPLSVTLDKPVHLSHPL